MTDEELKKWLGDLERKLLEPKRFIVFYSANREPEEYTWHISAYTVKDAFDQFMIHKSNVDSVRVLHIEPWTENCEEWRPWESEPYPRARKK